MRNPPSGSATTPRGSLILACVAGPRPRVALHAIAGDGRDRSVRRSCGSGCWAGPRETPPSLSRDALWTKLSCAWVAGPPSPENPAVPVPAIVVTMPSGPDLADAVAPGLSPDVPATARESHAARPVDLRLGRLPAVVRVALDACARDGVDVRRVRSSRRAGPAQADDDQRQKRADPPPREEGPHHPLPANPTRAMKLDKAPVRPRARLAGRVRFGERAREASLLFVHRQSDTYEHSRAEKGAASRRSRTRAVPWTSVREALRPDSRLWPTLVYAAVVLGCAVVWTSRMSGRGIYDSPTIRR